MSRFWKLWGRLVVLPVLAVVLTTAACNSTEPAPTSQSPIPTATPTPAPILRVVTTSNIVADWVRQVGRGRVEVFALLPMGADPHTFQPGARDITRVADADLILSVGLTLEAAWLEELVQNAAADSSKLVALGEIVDPIEFEGHDHNDEDEDKHGHIYRSLDPHFWFDPVRVKKAVSDIAAWLTVLDPTGGDAYRVNARSYNQELAVLHDWIRLQVNQIPPERRVLVTSHESFGYFAQRYQFTIVDTVIPGLTIELEPSAAELAELVDQIRKHQVPVIFTETTVNDRLARRIAEEVGVDVEGSLYTGSLGAPGSGADTYTGLMQTDVEAIVEALR